MPKDSDVRSPSVAPGVSRISRDVDQSTAAILRRIGNGDLPVAPEPQTTGDLPGHLNYVESRVFSAALNQSRLQWTIGGVVQKFWTKPTRSRKAQTDVIHTPKHNMSKLGECTLTIGPHSFPETKIYSIRYIPEHQHPTHSPSPLATAPGLPPQYHYQTAPGYPPQAQVQGQYQQPQIPGQTAAAPATAPPVTPGPTAPAHTVKQELPSTPAAAARPPVAPASVPQTPLQQSAAPSATPTPAPTTISTPTPAPDQPPPSPVAPQPPQAIAPAPAAAPMALPPMNNDIIMALRAAAAKDPALQKLLTVVAGGNASPAEISQLTTFIHTLPQAQEAVRQAAEAARLQAEAQARAQAEAQARAQALLIQQQQAAQKAMPKYLQNQDVVFEFKDNPNDRWLFPRMSIVEAPGDNEPLEVIASFMMTIPTKDPQKPMAWQPVTMVMEGCTKKIRDTIVAVVENPNLVREKMSEAMANMPRADPTFLQFRLPKGTRGHRLDAAAEPVPTKPSMPRQASFTAGQAHTPVHDRFSSKPKSVPKRRVQQSSRGKTCENCGTSDTPMFRRGPSGPNTLCNACGVRWKGGRGSLDPPPKKSPESQRASLPSIPQGAQETMPPPAMDISLVPPAVPHDQSHALQPPPPPAAAAAAPADVPEFTGQQ
ncbi:hypothetical protein YB2330_004249 [Saitoella coloradoensis]